jgi:hypothetical protein
MKNNYVDLSTMFQTNKHKMIPAGDQISEPDVISDSEQDIQFRCETVSEIVKDKIFPLKKALEIYNVTFRQYFGYLLLHDESKITIDSDVIQVFLTTMFNAMDLSVSHLDSKTEKVIADLRQLSSV